MMSVTLRRFLDATFSRAMKVFVLFNRVHKHEDTSLKGPLNVLPNIAEDSAY